MLIDGKPEKGKSLILYGENDYIIYKGDFLNFNYNGEGCSYFKGENKILYKGTFKEGKYDVGILYYEDGSKRYEGDYFNNVENGLGTLYFKGENKILYNGIFKNGKYVSGILYNEDGSKKYEGDFFNNDYDGKGTLYFKGENKILFNGIFKKGKYANGILYNDDGSKKCEGNFLNNSKIYFNIFFNGNTNEKYEGNFKNGYINGYGKLYLMDQDSKYYLYYEGNFIQNEICGKGIKYYINGSKKIEGIFESINSYEGKYYNPKGEEIYNGKIINEVPMNFKDKILYNDLGLIVYDGKIYNGGYKNEKKESKFNKKEIRNLKRLSVTFLSRGCSGKTSLIRNLEGKEFDEYIPNTNMYLGIEEYNYDYQYNNNQYGLILIDTSGQERYKIISLIQGRKAKIILYRK